MPKFYDLDPPCFIQMSIIFKDMLTEIEKPTGEEQGNITTYHLMTRKNTINHISREKSKKMAWFWHSLDLQTLRSKTKYVTELFNDIYKHFMNCIIQ